MIKKGNYILLVGKKNYLVRAGSEKFTTEFGDFDLKNLIGKKFGSKIKTHLNYEFTAVQPKLPDLLKKIKRLPQIITLKDAGLISSYTGLGKEDIVVEAGTGSGALTIFLANIAKHVYTYDIRKDFQQVAMQNFEKIRAKNITAKLKDITKGIDEQDVDIVVLDMEKPERAFKHAKNALKPGGYLVVFAPIVEQLTRFYPYLKDFSRPESFECILRHWEIKPGVGGRPRTVLSVPAHTGFLTFARKI